jgi:CRP/FNR family transcriptional regulator
MIADPDHRSALLAAFPFLAGADDGFRSTFFGAASLAVLPAGQPIARQGEGCAHLALVLSGTARVFRLGESGREITLYRIRSGESCVLTASCILRHGPFPAFAECETGVEAALVGQSDVDRWLRLHQPWRDFVFGLVSDRLLEVIGLLDAVVFQRLEQRLARRLLNLAGDAEAGDLSIGGIAVTHQSLAADLGSSREVVSRLLRTLEDRGLVRTGRGRLGLLDRAGLESMAGAL